MRQMSWTRIRQIKNCSLCSMWVRCELRMNYRSLWEQAKYKMLFAVRGRFFEKSVEAEEFAAEGAAVGGPLGFAGVDGEGGADGGELGIEVVHVVEGHRFANHGELGRAEFVLAVMADEEMLDDGFQIGGGNFDCVPCFGNGFEFPHDVAEELAFDSVADGALEAEFIELADGMEKDGAPPQT